MTVNETIEKYINDKVQLKKNLIADMQAILAEIGMDGDVVRKHDGRIGVIKVVDPSTDRLPEYRFYLYINNGQLARTQSGRIMKTCPEKYILKTFKPCPSVEDIPKEYVKNLLIDTMERARKKGNKRDQYALNYALKCMDKVDLKESEVNVEAEE